MKTKSLQWWNKKRSIFKWCKLSYHINDIRDEAHFVEVARILEASRNTRLRQYDQWIE